MTLFDWLSSGGLWNSLVDIGLALVNKLIGFFTWLGGLFVELITNILTGVGSVLPDPTPFLNTFQSMFDFVSPYVGYIVDMTLISSPVIVYFVVSLIFRILAKRNVYVVKLIVGWFQKLKK